MHSKTEKNISIWKPFVQGQCLIPMAEIAGLSWKGLNLANVVLANVRLMEGDFTCHTPLNRKMTAALHNH